MKQKIKIESMGVYFPEKNVSTKSVLTDCNYKLMRRLPMALITGIHSRPMAGETQFSIDLAEEAIKKCFVNSQYNPQDIDVVIVANISKYDEPNLYSIEPSTAAALGKKIGLGHAFTCDVGNACAGVFTAIFVADKIIQSGNARRVLIVSGEYITHLTKTAQREITSIRDLRIACLTLGDAGIALLLEAHEGEEGFDYVEMRTVPEYADLCIAHAADSSGAIMFTNTEELARNSIENAIHYHHLVTSSHNRGLDFVMMIPHQIASSNIKEIIHATNKHFGRRLLNSHNIIDNLKYRGNSATTSHWVALHDAIHDNRITTEKEITFAVAASGITVGFGQYSGLDNLSERIRGKKAPQKRTPADHNAHSRLIKIAKGERLYIKSAALHKDDNNEEHGNIEYAVAAGNKALARAGCTTDELNYLMHTGMYSKLFLSEPAKGALVAQNMQINASCVSKAEHRFFTFDIMDGPTGMLKAIFFASTFLREKSGRVMITASEYIDRQQKWKKDTLTIRNMGSALLLERSNGESGFSVFYFRNYYEHLDDMHTKVVLPDDRSDTEILAHIDPALHEYYIAAIAETVKRMLDELEMSIEDIALIFPPQISLVFNSALSKALKIDESRIISCGASHLFTSELPAAWEAKPETKEGEVGLFISVSAGINVSCALYYF